MKIVCYLSLVLLLQTLCFVLNSNIVDIEDCMIVFKVQRKLGLLGKGGAAQDASSVSVYAFNFQSQRITAGNLADEVFVYVTLVNARFEVCFVTLYVCRN